MITNTHEIIEVHNSKKRTHGDLLRALLDMIHPAARAQFEQEVLPKMHLPMAQQEIGEEEYQILLEQFRRELPAFLQFLQDYRPG